jgi:hypothetical protein
MAPFISFEMPGLACEEPGDFADELLHIGSAAGILLSASGQSFERGAGFFERRRLFEGYGCGEELPFFDRRLRVSNITNQQAY